MNKGPVLRTAEEVIQFLKKLPPDTTVFIDTEPLNGGSFEHLRADDTDSSGNIISFNLTRHGE